MLLNFTNFLLEATAKVKTMNAKEGDDDGDRHFRKYINPGSNVTLARDHEGISAGSDVEVVGKKTINGVHHATVRSGKKTVHVPLNKLAKPTGKQNKGLAYEQEFVQHLIKHGVMRPGSSGAGFTDGNDFHIFNRKTGKVHEGKVSEDFKDESDNNKASDAQGEAKESLKADFGQLTLSHDPEKGGWHISDKARQNRSEYAKSIENASITVDGKKKSLLQHINDTVPPPTKGKVTKSNFYSDDTDLSPMHSYLRDHHVDVLHIGSHGTFRAGLSEKRDNTATGLPVAKGTGKFRVRGKHKTGNLMIAFNPTQMEKSTVDIHKNADHMEAFKNTIGITPGSENAPASTPTAKPSQPSRPDPGAADAADNDGMGAAIGNRSHDPIEHRANSSHGGFDFHSSHEKELIRGNV